MGSSVQLCDAFFNDPFYKAIFPRIDKRQKQLQWWMTCIVNYGSKYGIVDRSEYGGAVWLGPANPYYGLAKLLKAGMYKIPFMLTLSEIETLYRITHLWEKVHRTIKTKYMYLMILGIHPEQQRKGFGSQLIKARLNTFAEDNLSCYLETMTKGNLKYYTRHNFNIYQCGKTHHNLPYWIMTKP